MGADIANQVTPVPMSPTLGQTLTRAAQYAQEQSHAEVALDHLLLSLTEDDDARGVMLSSGVDIGALQTDVSQQIGRLDARLPPGEEATVSISEELRRILNAAAVAARAGRRTMIDGAIVLAAIIGDAKTSAAGLLKAHGLTFEVAINVIRQAGRPALPPSKATPGQLPPPARSQSPLNDAPHPPNASRTEPAAASETATRSPAPSTGNETPRPGFGGGTVAVPATSPSQNLGGADNILAEARNRIASRKIAGYSDQVAARNAADSERPHQPAMEKHDAPDLPAGRIEAIEPSPLAPDRKVPPAASIDPIDKPAGNSAENRGRAEAGTDPFGLPEPEPEPEQYEPEPREPAPQLPPLPPQSELPPAPPRASAPPPPAPDRVHPAPPPVERTPPAPPPPRPHQQTGASWAPPPSGPPPPPAAAPPRGAPPPIPPAMPSRPPGPVPTGRPSLADRLPPDFGASSASAAQVARREPPWPGPTAPPVGGRPPPPPARPPDSAAPLPSPEEVFSANTRARQQAERAPPPQREPAPRAQPDRPQRKPGHAPDAAHSPTVLPGQLIENVPRRMRVGVSSMVEVRIAKAEVKAISDGLDINTTHRHEIQVTKAMSVRLRAPDGGFFIETASPETQWIENALGLMADDYARWRWTVTPKLRGKRRLQLIVAARTVGPDGLAAETALPDQIIEIKVAANYAVAARRAAGWTVAAVLGGLLAQFGAQIWTVLEPLLRALLQQ